MKSIILKNACICFAVFCFAFLLIPDLQGENIASGHIWIKTFKPGSANLSDATLDQDKLSLVDSLMQRTDMEVSFLGASDKLLWKQAKGNPDLSRAWDEAKKLERARQLRKRYGRGEIGLADESVRGVKVVWERRKSDLFDMENRISKLESLTDSLKEQLMAANIANDRSFRSLKDSLAGFLPEQRMTTLTEIKTSYFDWEVNSGMYYWTGGSKHDLTVPYIGIALNRDVWGIELQGGFTPWSSAYKDTYGNRGDAFLMGCFNMFPKENYEIKVGLFSGWEYLTDSDNWTMKITGLTAGPNFKLNFMNVYLGYNMGKLSTLTEPGRWVHGGSLSVNFNLKLN